MKIKFKKARILLVCIACLLSYSFTLHAVTPARYYYQLKIYHLKNALQQSRVNNYLQNAYLPALHRAGIANVGVFEPVEQNTADKRIYVFIPYRSWDQLLNIDEQLLKDKAYLNNGKDYVETSYDNQPYNRIETILLQAFDKAPAPLMPKLTSAKASRIYELRSYEGPTEKYYANKVKMFNNGNETLIFNRLNFNPVFYAKVIAGSHMPNLMYMTTFNDKADRDKHWDTFSNDPEWKSLSSRPEYQHNVSKADILFLHPTAYSDI